jgi:hypothetical protein
MEEQGGETESGDREEQRGRKTRERERERERELALGPGPGGVNGQYHNGLIMIRLDPIGLGPKDVKLGDSDSGPVSEFLLNKSELLPFASIN